MVNYIYFLDNNGLELEINLRKKKIHMDGS